MNIQVNTLDLHVAIVPSVAVEFTTIIDSGDMDSPTSPSYDGPSTTGVEHAEEPSPMDNEEFAYPTNLTSEVLDYEDEEGEQAAPGSSTNQRTSIAGISGSNMFSWDDMNDDNMARGHFRANNPSTGSDLIQVTVEDLLISEEQDRTIKASMDQCRQEQEHHPPTLAPSLSTSNNATKNSVTTTTITATIRSNGQNKKAISFDNMERPPAATEQQEPPKQPLTSVQSQQTHIKESRLLQPPAPRVLTPAQQREADTDANIQKAIELHENNLLEEATHHFWLAAQSENPLGQLMYGLSLRHGWGCKPNPTEALLFLQRAAEYAMGELNELGPVQPRISPSTASTAAAPSSSTDRAQKQDQQQVSHQKSNSNPTQQTLRRMGSMDRTAAMITARKELVMALYELGMSYLKGWGVTKDKSVAFTYFKIAADLGDPDSQNETAMCYYEGIGTDKDMYQSAKYYRMAAAQGASQLGNSWIWKPKYDMYCAAENAAALAVGSGSTTGKKGQDPRSKFAFAINTAIFQGAGGAGGAGTATASASSSSSSSSPTSSSNSPSSSKKKTKPQSSAPTSPAIPSPNHYSVSAIASGFASVTAATSTGTTVVAASIKRPVIPSSMPITTTTTTTTTTSSAKSSVDDLRTPTSSRSSRSFRASTEFSPTSPSPLIVSSTPGSSITEAKQGAGLMGTVEKKKARWSLWSGGTHRSTITPSPAPTLQS